MANGKPKFYLNDLREHSQELFGVKPEVLDGAFLNVKETQITKDEADKMIKDFLKKEVK
ncbi:hypothetical protein [Oceanobacillus sp. CF4.6]|uniref:hypothetical protein n=1 Tax=Oceanobacillus sp. CF4.6 TaxID=3373080 RepID=UPI003EE618B7